MAMNDSSKICEREPKRLFERCTKIEAFSGNAVLKLSDGRKRSMSLWVEFITASGYLSARKIRSRFQSLVEMTVEKPPFR